MIWAVIATINSRIAISQKTSAFITVPPFTRPDADTIPFLRLHLRHAHLSKPGMTEMQKSKKHLAGTEQNSYICIPYENGI